MDLETKDLILFFFFGDDNQFLREKKNISDEYIIFVSHSEAEKSERTKERERGK
jgi:hypothetical protein